MGYKIMMDGARLECDGRTVAGLHSLHGPSVDLTKTTLTSTIYFVAMMAIKLWFISF